MLCNHPGLIVLVNWMRALMHGGIITPLRSNLLLQIRIIPAAQHGRFLMMLLMLHREHVAPLIIMYVPSAYRSWGWGPIDAYY